MSIYQHDTTFYSLPIKEFKNAGDLDRKSAYRFSMSWDDEEKTVIKLLEDFVEQKGIAAVTALVIGMWDSESAETSAEVVAALVNNKDKLAGLEAIFLGDIIGEENEISWIQQSDVSPLLTAFPKLKLLRVRGGNGLRFSKIRHEALQQLIVETGGLPRNTIREICRCDFPSLDHLELWLCVQNYGFDGGVEDLQPILAGKRLPALRYLGLRNSEIIDDIAPVVVNAPILKQLEILDLSNGALSDVGGKALLNLPSGLPLKKIDLTHHYMTPEMVKQLQKKHKYKIVADDGKDPNEEWRSVVASE